MLKFRIKVWLGQLVFLCLCMSLLPIASQTVSVAADNSYLELEKDVFLPGESIKVNFHNGAGNAKDWIGLYNDPPVPGASLSWGYVNNTQSATYSRSDGTVDLVTPTNPGNYILRFFKNDGYETIAQDVHFTVSSGTSNTPTLTLDKTAYEPGETATVRFNNGPGNPKDWIGLYKESTTGKSYLAWEYVNDSQTSTKGIRNGIVHLKLPIEAGNYFVRFYENNGYSPLGSDVHFTVKTDVVTNTPVQLKIMTFNTWHGGNSVDYGVEKIVDAINQSGADIIGFQEVPDPAVKVADKLGNGWYYYQKQNLQYGQYDTSIVSRYPIYDAFDIDGVKGVAALIRLPSGQKALVMNNHLWHDPYGPYWAHFDNRSVSDIISMEESARGQEIQASLAKLKSYMDAGIPVFLIGDFNAPSHLDWTENTKSSHNGYVVEWPISKRVEQAGLLDSYRVVHPNPVESPGNTWSPIYPNGYSYGGTPYEPQDRIDFIYYKGNIQVTDSKVIVVGNPKPYGQHRDNLYPSDHASVLSSFIVNPYI